MPEAVSMWLHHPGPDTGKLYLQEKQENVVFNYTDFIITLPNFESQFCHFLVVTLIQLFNLSVPLFFHSRKCIRLAS